MAAVGSLIGDAARTVAVVDVGAVAHAAGVRCAVGVGDDEEGTGHRVRRSERIRTSHDDSPVD